MHATTALQTELLLHGTSLFTLRHTQVVARCCNGTTVDTIFAAVLCQRDLLSRLTRALPFFVYSTCTFGLL